MVPGAPWSLSPIVPNAVTAERSEQELEIDIEKLEQYQEFSAGINQVLQKYEAAMREMTVRFEILDRDLSLKRNRNPIHHIESRIKSPLSIYDKLLRYGKDPTIGNLEEYLMDVAGVRVICSYVNDVKSLMGLLRRQDDLEIVRVKNYIEKPKPNGYRSLHAIVRIPVFFMDSKQMIPVEVQIRTIAMDYWASLEHDLRYKSATEVGSDEFSAELLACSKTLEELEGRMQLLANILDSKPKKDKKNGKSSKNKKK
ncbi:MAG: (p)ppGpp synthetase [Eggerthellaceae bacterium]|nr:(p)ppGpp synthetase [Eggerthellaceae bacterium]